MEMNDDIEGLRLVYGCVREKTDVVDQSPSGKLEAAVWMSPNKSYSSIQCICIIIYAAY